MRPVLVSVLPVACCLTKKITIRITPFFVYVNKHVGI